jgi:hypothetical protein
VKTHSKILGLSLAAVLSAGFVAAPGLASAQSYRYKSSTHSEDGARTNALALGAAGLLLLGNHQSTLGTIALGAAALQGIQMQNDIKARHDRESRYGYNGYGYNRSGYDSYGYPYGTTHGLYSDGGYYDQYGAYHLPSSNSGYRRDGDNDRDDNGWSRNSSDRGRSGRDWSATRGNKRGWDKNGKRDDSDRNSRDNWRHARG